MLRYLMIAAAASASIAHADVRIHDANDAVSMPYASWELRFPGAGWVLEQQRRSPDGGQFYYLFANFKRKIVASFYLEPAYKCATSEACRDKFWANPGPAFLNRANDRLFAAGPFSVVEFTTQAGNLVQRHWSAHSVHEGVWIDMHLSTVSLPDFSELKAFGEEVSVAKKAECPECFSAAGISRQESLILFGSARANDKAAFDRLVQLADGGDPEAQFMVARLYSFGSPFSKSDETRSVALTQKAAEQGHAEAQSNLAFFHVSGRGVPAKDPKLALEWWTKAATQGFAPAQYSLGSFYAQEKDDAKAFDWYRKAALQGLAIAQASVGSAYLRGNGTERNFGEAVEWYRKGAMQANERAMLNLAAAFSMAGTTDPKFYGAALAVLDEPLLRPVEPAQKLRASICTAHADLCQKRNPR